MLNLNRALFFFVLMLLFVFVPISQGQSSCAVGEWLLDGDCVSDFSALDTGWYEIFPEGDTRCAHDTDYRFWYRPGNEDVMVYFQGGGGCWNQDTCRNGSNFYKQVARPNEAERYNSGVFDFDNPANPFTEHSIIFAPSCTGDVYMGSDLVDYGDDVVVHHRGYDNLLSALEFTQAVIPEPDSIFTTGCSAGSVGSAVAVPLLIEAYPDVPVTQLGDSLGLIFDTSTDMTDLWGTPNDFYTDTLAEFAPNLNSFTMANYYLGLGLAYPEYSFAQFNYRYDTVQQRYFADGVANPRDFLREGLTESLTTIADGVDNFNYYLADAQSHCIMPSADLYRRTENGIAAIDWVTAVANGEPVENVITD